MSGGAGFRGSPFLLRGAFKPGCGEKYLSEDLPIRFVEENTGVAAAPKKTRLIDV